MRTSLAIPLLVLAPLLGACRAAGSSASPIAQRIEEAHGGDRWYATPGLETHLTVVLGGRKALEGTLLFEPASGRARIDLANGHTMVFDGRRAWVTGDAPMARFHLLTWPYFLGVPWKLEDGGTRLVAEGERELLGATFDAARLTFDPGTGDTPEDWYLLFLRSDGRLEALAYIVTYGTDLAQAEAQPSLALYGDYGTVGGMELPGELALFHWSEAQGAGEEPKGTATFEGTRVVEPPEDAFDVPVGAVLDELPR